MRDKIIHHAILEAFKKVRLILKVLRNASQSHVILIFIIGIGLDFKNADVFCG